MTSSRLATHAVYPAIPPMPAGIHRPLWSIMIPTFNCADYLAATLASVLRQCPSDDVQLEVVDDASTRDDPAAVVRACGDRRVHYFRQPVNVGPQANFTTCIQRARGQWVHILHGDDMVAPGFYAALEGAAAAAPSIGAAFCRTMRIDAAGDPLDLTELESPAAGVQSDLIGRLAIDNRIMFPSIAVRRDTYERVGGFHPGLFHSADWDMWKRVALAVPVWYEPEPLAMYRVHDQSDTSTLMRTGANIADARHAIEIAWHYLPPERRDDLTKRARLYHGLYALELAEALIDRGGWRSAAAQIREAFRCTTTFPVLARTARVTLRAVQRMTGKVPAPTAEAVIVAHLPGRGGQTASGPPNVRRHPGADRA
jgi:glycosyltransferase involved in cell wall biosynthesis